MPIESYAAKSARYIPAELLQQIGRAIILYADLEQSIGVLPAVILGINKVEARIAVREPRVTDRLEMIKELLGVKGIKPASDIDALKKDVEEISIKRDWLAHGVWIQNPRGALCLRVTKGSYVPPDEKKKHKRLLYPEAIEFGEADCKALCEKTVAAILKVDALGAEIDAALEAWRKKSPPRLPPRYQQ